MPSPVITAQHLAIPSDLRVLDEESEINDVIFVLACGILCVVTRVEVYPKLKSLGDQEWLPRLEPGTRNR